MGDMNKWVPWAEQQSFFAGFFLLVTGLVGMWYPLKWVSGVGMCSGLFMMVIEKYLKKYPPFNNYTIRGVLYILFGALGLGQAPTTTAGLLAMSAGITYIAASRQ